MRGLAVDVIKPKAFRLLKKMVGWVLASFIVGLVVLLIAKSEWAESVSSIGYFQVKEVKFETQWPITQEEAHTWLPKNWEKQNLLFLSSKKLAAHLLEKPWVENLAIKKEFPNRLRIHIEAKKAFAVTVSKGSTYFVDRFGKLIDRASPALLGHLDLPFLSKEHENVSPRWQVDQVLESLEKFRKSLGTKAALSQVVLGDYPYLKVFLTSPKIEVLINIENWENQKAVLSNLLLYPPRQLGELVRINLIFPKKAVVRAKFSP